MNQVIQILIVLFFVLLAGSFYSSCDSSDYLNSLYSEDESDSSSRRRSRARSRVRTDNKCENSERCQTICDQILDYTEDQRNCYLLSLDEIGDIEDTLDILNKTNLDESDLSDIESRKFDLFIDYGARSWIKVMKGTHRDSHNQGSNDDNYGERESYTSSEAKEVLRWMRNAPWARDGVGHSFSAEDILYELLFRSGESCTRDELRFSSPSPSVTLKIDSSHLCRVGTALKEQLPLFANLEISREDLTYEAMHQVVQDVCDEAVVQGKNYSSSKNHKICLTLLYFGTADRANVVTDQGRDSNYGVSRFLFKNTRNSLVRDFVREDPANPRSYFITGSSHEPKSGVDHSWSDYW